jgi:hypothetical protein
MAVVIHAIATLNALNAGIAIGKAYPGRGVLIPAALAASSYFTCLAATERARNDGSSVRHYPLLLIVLSGILFDCIIFRLWL